MAKEDKILHIGCGNSRLPEELAEEGYTNITNVDFSQKAIMLMEERCREKYPSLVFTAMNVLDMKELGPGSFNVVLDKGTLDSILCSDNAGPDCMKMLEEIYRVLAPGGRYICITYGDPEHRKKHLETQTWEKLQQEKINKPATSSGGNANADENDPKNFHYIYIMTKPK